VCRVEAMAIAKNSVGLKNSRRSSSCGGFCQDVAAAFSNLEQRWIPVPLATIRCSMGFGFSEEASENTLVPVVKHMYQWLIVLL
jgi:hypothetical protein